MFKYLLPGSEFRDALRDKVPNICDEVTNIIFGYSDNYESYVSGIEPIMVDTMDDGTINAYISADHTHIYVLSDYDIHIRDCQMMFYRMRTLCRITFENFNTDECTNMHRMFMTCKSLMYLDMSNLTSAKVRDYSEMFSGCLVCSFIDIRNFTLDVGDETCNYSDMFINIPSLRRLSVGADFQFSVAMQLSNPDKGRIPFTNGKWNSLATRTSYDADNLPSNVATTYYAIDVNTNDFDNAIVSFGVVKEMIAQMSITMNSLMSILSKN